MQAPPADTAIAPWSAPFLAGLPPDAARLSPLRVDDDWQPLEQAWRGGAPEPAFYSGWAQVHWSPDALHFSAIFIGSAQRNRARRLNERTWELGDICEVFLQGPADGPYLELHVTPENQRLQLLWPAGGVERFRRHEAPLDDFLVAQPDWVRSSTRVGPGFWAARVTVPWSCLGLEAGAAPALRAAVCRYDYGGRTEPVWSSTAPLREANFHRPHEWQPLALLPAASSARA